MTTKFYLNHVYNQVYRFISLILVLSLSYTSLQAQPILSLTPVVASGLSAPIQFVNAGDGTNRSFIVQKGGAVLAYDAAFNLLGTFVTVSNVSTDGERGLLSLAFHPQYASNGFCYVYYTNLQGNLEIARYHVSANANQLDTASKVVVITIPHPVNANHNGGELHFGADGFLYLSTGDGGGAGDASNNAQNTGVLLGKIIRINVNTSDTAPYYTIPAGNPYNNGIYATGLRNPFRWSFDRLTGDMWIGDVGQGAWEEIDFRAAANTNGANYGWRCYEGESPYNTAGCGGTGDYVFPVHVYPNPGGAAVTGGVVYRGTLSPAMYGYYVATDFYSGEFFIVSPDGAGGWTTATQTLPVTGIADFGETESGEVYVLSLTANTLYRLNAVEGAPVPVTLVNFTGAVVDKQVQLSWKTTLEQDIQLFEVEFSTDGNTFNYAGTVKALNQATGSGYTFLHNPTTSGDLFYRLKIKENNGTFRYSNVIRVNPGVDGLLVAPSVINDGIIRINLVNATFTSVEVLSSGGNILMKQNIEGQSGRINLPSADLASGIYLVRFITKAGEPVIQKIVVK